jgi:hypothetical protein
MGQSIHCRGSLRPFEAFHYHGGSFAGAAMPVWPNFFIAGAPRRGIRDERQYAEARGRNVRYLSWADARPGASG